MGERVPRARSNGLEIAYEAFGDPSSSPLVLVIGLATQMLGWPDSFCHELAGRGHYVVRFDNRDSGLSTHLDDLPVPSTWDLLTRRRAPYGISDLADDVRGLLDALELESAHLVGASMGGFVCQALALAHPERVRTLTLMMTSTGSRFVGQPRPRLLPRLLRFPEPTSLEEAIGLTLEVFRLIGSPGYPLDEQHLRQLARRSWERGGATAAGERRQLAAAATQPDRTRQLGRLRLPALVMHGLDDPLVRVSGGLALARAIPRSTFVGYAGMGHDLPRQLRGRMVEQIASLTGAASE